METIVEVPVAVPDSSRVELETEISHYKGLLKETESMVERLQVRDNHQTPISRFHMVDHSHNFTCMSLELLWISVLTILQE